MRRQLSLRARAAFFVSMTDGRSLRRGHGNRENNICCGREHSPQRTLLLSSKRMMEIAAVVSFRPILCPGTKNHRNGIETATQ